MNGWSAAFHRRALPVGGTSSLGIDAAVTRFRCPGFALWAILLAGSVALLASPAAAASDRGLAGAWRIDLTRSTELSPWKSFDLIIAVDGSRVALTRKLAWGRREFIDTIELDTAKTENLVPIAWWPDNRHIGAYIGENKTRRIRAEWIDDRRLLRLSIDLVLEAQQGPHAVNILSDYKVSASGAQLTLTELRSTRNRPVFYVFNRLPPEPKP